MDTEAWEFSCMVVLPILILHFITFLFLQYRQENFSQNVLAYASLDYEPQIPKCKAIVSNVATQTLEDDCWSSKKQQCKTTISNMATQTLEDDILPSSSEEENYCDICDNTQEANTYCSQCKQYLCIQCFKIHKKISLTKDHEFINCEDVTEKMLKSRHLALLSTIHLPYDYLPGNKLIGFSNTENNTVTRFVALRTYIVSKYFLHISVGIMDSQDGKFVSSNDITFKNLKVLDSTDTSQKLFYLVTVNEITYFTFRSYKSVCTMEKDMKTASVVFKTPGYCYGITKFDNGLALVHEKDGSFETPKWQIHVYNFEGVLKQQILYDKNRCPLFEQPEYLTSNTEENILYATDTKKNLLYAFDTKGTVLFIFQSKAMVSPRGVSTDYEGNIYIACHGRVLQLQENGVKYRTILYMKKEGKGNITKTVEDVYFDRENTQLAVIEDHSHGSVFRFLSD